jgi:hypothetical protein
MSDPVEEILRAAQQDQVKVSLFVAGAQLSGAVARVEAGVVELREGAERTTVRIDRVDAVRRQ